MAIILSKQNAVIFFKTPSFRPQTSNKIHLIIRPDRTKIIPETQNK